MTTRPDDTGAHGFAVPYVLDDGEGEAIRWFGATITVKASGPQFDVALTTEVAGSEPPLHVHAGSDEALYVLSGRLTVYAGDDVFAAAAGSFAFLPRLVPHTFAVDSGSARLVAVVAPAVVLPAYSEAEQQFGAGGMPARPRQADLAALVPVLAQHGITVVGPNPRHAARDGELPRHPRTAPTRARPKEAT